MKNDNIKRSIDNINNDLNIKKLKKETINNDTALDYNKKIMDIAIYAATEAGKHMQKHIGMNTVIAEIKSSKDDLVTRIDKECQNIIERIILKSFPKHEILGEENIQPGAKESIKALKSFLNKDTTRYTNSKWLWIIDPIDGTTNFIHNRPSSVISIAVSCDGIVQIGLIYDPYRKEYFKAIRNNGFYLNDKKIELNNNKNNTDNYFSKALIGFGIGTKGSVRIPMLECIQKISENCRGIRCQGSAALELAWVASGRQTGFYELDLNAWDIAAGALLVQEAGGKVTDSIGKEYELHTRHIVATNGKNDIHDKMLLYINKSNATVPREMNTSSNK